MQFADENVNIKRDFELMLKALEEKEIYIPEMLLSAIRNRHVHSATAIDV